MRPTPRPGQPPEAQLSDILDGAAAVIACGLVAFSLVGIQGFPRVLLALGFLAFVPGRAAVVHWSRLAAWSEVAVSMLFSLVSLALLAAVTLWVHYWHPLGLMQAEAGLSVLVLAVAVFRRHRYQLPSGRGRHAADQDVR